MLTETFIDLLTKYTDNSELINELWIEIENSYTSKNRHYHTLHHLDNLLEQLSEVKKEIQNWDTILFSIYYHDIIYIASKSDNEEKSAELATKRMNQVSISPEMIKNCVNQILATKSHQTSEHNTDSSYFIDADLSISGQNEDRYKEYSKSIRMEFLFYPSIIYNEGRRKVLSHFLNMERIFKTDYFYFKYENQAKLNIKNELESLRTTNEYYLETNKQWVFIIEDDGDWYEFFHDGAEILDNTEGVEKITYYPGFFDSGYYRFYYKKVKLSLEYEGMLGIDLRTESNPSESDLRVAKEIYELLKNVRNKIHS